MSSEGLESAGDIIALGDQTYLFSAPFADIYKPYRALALGLVDFRLRDRPYSLLRLKPEDRIEPNNLPLDHNSRKAELCEEDCSALLELISQDEGLLALIQEDASAIKALVAMHSKQGPAKVAVTAYRVRGLDTAILVFPRESDLSSRVAIWAGSEAGYEPLRIIESGRFLAAKKPSLRLAAAEMRSGLQADEMCALTGQAAATFALNTIYFATVEDFYQRCSHDNHDVLQMFYQCCKQARQQISTLLARRETPKAASDPRWGFHIEFDAACQLGHGCFLSGWYLDPEERLLEAIVLDHRLEHPDILDQWTLSDETLHREARREPAKRFRVFLGGALHGDPLAIRVHLTLRGGISLFLHCPVDSYEAVKQRDAILATIADPSFSLDLFDNVYAPALAPLQQTINERQGIRSRHAFGQRSKRTVSIIIPLYSQLSFVRSQLMAFARDPFVRSDCQILYALDDPRLAQETQALLQGYQSWAPLDIELLVLERNGGYAVANNTAFSTVDGQATILLNSDVIPIAPAWIEKALEELDQAPPFSVVGPKLLYADDSLQHAGMLFKRFPHGFWQNLHYWKGFGRSYAPATQRRNVPAVTGACMILRSSDYSAVGGFTSDYIKGDYEDSDLCLKLRQRGGHCIYAPSIELYHFERQSMPSIDDGHDRRSTIYNRALHTRRWNEVIIALMAEFG